MLAEHVMRECQTGIVSNEREEDIVPCALQALVEGSSREQVPCLIHRTRIREPLLEPDQPGARGRLLEGTEPHQVRFQLAHP